LSTRAYETYFQSLQVMGFTKSMEDGFTKKR
jgi:hypothetical protein